MLNRTILIGRLTKEPDLRYTQTGVAVCSFVLAVDRPRSQDRENEADFIPIVVWRQAAEACANHLKKGRLVAIEGRIQVRNYENNEGRRVYVTEVHADNVRFLPDSNREPSGQSENPPRQSDNPYESSTRGQGQSKPYDVDDSDLPF